ncbi:MAG: Hachiman antiphage defense system protein HamA [Halobacteriota archaeon]|nr:Hachiman antiphage defense system protein HamA [Halobacteriota archaeon]
MEKEAEEIIKQAKEKIERMILVEAPNNRKRSLPVNLKNWLKEPIDLESNSDDAYYLLEFDYIDGSLKDYLKDCIRDSYSDPEKISKHLKYLNLTTLLNLIKTKIPKSSSTQKNEFGEILCRVTLEDFFSLVIPVCKLHYKTDPESPVHGMDVVAFRFGDDPLNDCVYMVEVKTAPSKSYARNSPRRIKERFEELEKTDFGGIWVHNRWVGNWEPRLLLESNIDAKCLRERR